MIAISAFRMVISICCLAALAVGCTDERSEVHPARNVDEMIKAAAIGMSEKNYTPAANLWSTARNDNSWGQDENARLIAGLSDSNESVRTFCAMAFPIYASQLTADQGIALYKATKTDIKLRTVLTMSVYMTLSHYGKDEGETLPASALAIDAEIKRDQ